MDINEFNHFNWRQSNIRGLPFVFFRSIIFGIKWKIELNCWKAAVVRQPSRCDFCHGVFDYTHTHTHTLTHTLTHALCMWEFLSPIVLNGTNGCLFHSDVISISISSCISWKSDSSQRTFFLFLLLFNYYYNSSSSSS